jgi:hypothetical protein
MAAETSMMPRVYRRADDNRADERNCRDTNSDYNSSFHFLLLTSSTQPAKIFDTY